MSSTKISKQPQEAWTTLHHRLTSMDFRMDSVIRKESVRKFIQDQANAISCCPGYVLAGLLSTVLFVVGLTNNLITPSGHQVKPNLYTLICGPPSTGKSQAVTETTVHPLNTIANETDEQTPIIEKTTSSGLTRRLSAENKGYLASTEIFDSLYKLLRGDGDCDGGDTTLLCKLFSGECVTLTYGGQAQRVIPANTPFVIFGCIQVYPLAKLMALLDQGHGLLDRFLVSVPMCLRPSPAVSRESRERLENLPISSFTDIFTRINELAATANNFSFDEDASRLVSEMEEDYINRVNEALQNGLQTPKSKTDDLTKRVALAIHVFSSVTEAMLLDQEMDAIPAEITTRDLEAASYYVSFCEMQKKIFTQFVYEVVSSSFDPPKYSPTAADIRQAIALFPGKLVTLRALTGSGPRAVRSTSEAEFVQAVEALNQFGRSAEVQVPRSRKPTKVFIKKVPAEIADEAWTNGTGKEEYTERFYKSTHTKITPNMKQRLVEAEGLEAMYLE